MSPVAIFRFIDAEKAHFPIAFMCARLGVSVSGYYAWRSRPPSVRAVADARLTTTIHLIHAGSRGTYGAPRIHAELREEHQVRCGRKRVARLMRIARLRGVCRRRQARTTRRDEQATVSDDLVHRRFTAEAPDRLWTADITHLPTWQGFLYLAVIIDTFSRKVVGWSMAAHMRTDLVLDALEMALWHRRPAAGLVHHTDHGSQTKFKGSSQHLREGSCDEETPAPIGSGGTSAHAVAGTPAGGSSGGSATLLGGHRPGPCERGRRSGGDCFDCEDPGALLRSA